jgi:hypothetical protein
MIWSLLLLTLLIVALTMLIGHKRTAWSDKLQRTRQDTPQAEWNAPDYVHQQVRNDYLMATRWMRDCAFSSWTEQWAGAPYYFAGLHLHRHQKILTKQRAGQETPYRDLMDAEHFIEVRHFSSDGERCLVIDHQTERTITTYHHTTCKPWMRQALDDAAVIYQMVYDRSTSRWKIEQFVQELPSALRTGRMTNQKRVKVLAELPPTLGRDH